MCEKMTNERKLVPENSKTHLTVISVREGNKKPQVVAATFATLIALSAGSCLAWSSPALNMLSKKDSFLPVTETQGAWIGSLLTLGAFLGAIPAGSVTSYLGRKRALQVSAVPFLVSWMAIAFGKSVALLYVARVLAGIGIGVASVAAPIYVAELAESSIKGMLGTFFQAQLTVGLLFEYAVGAMPLMTFQGMALVSSALAVLFVTCFSFMPESPVYLCEKGDVKGATRSLSWFRGPDYDTADEINEIRDNIRESSINKPKLSDLINCKATSRGLIISLGLMMFQQLSGINAVLFYADRIFSESGSSMSPSLCSCIVGTIMVLATFMSTMLIDRLGRKILLLTSSSIMMLCLVALGLYFHIKKFQDLSSFSIVPLISLGLYIIVFSIGFGPIPWLMMGEIFTPKTKAIAASISASFNWLIAFAVTNQFQTLLDAFGIGIAFMIFGGICAVATVFVLVVLPETKGKTVEEVQDMLLGIKKVDVPKRISIVTSSL